MARLAPFRSRRITISQVRLSVASVALLAVVAGEFLRIGFGTICSLGIGWFTVTCPLGFLQLALAARDPLPSLWPSVALGVLTIVIAGRYFCAWVCPTVLVQSWFGRRAQAALRPLSELGSALRLVRGDSRRWGVVADPKERQGSLLRYGVLGGSLVSSFLFGFPVFCAVCPVGLFFGSLFAVKRLFLGQEPGWELLVFPAVILIEILLAKPWCRSFCPLGALLGLLAPFNKVLRPSVEGERCLRSRGTCCTICERICPEGVALASTPGVAAVKDCTKCLSCFEKCPAKAIDL